MCVANLTPWASCHLWVVHAPGMPGSFSPPPTSKETTSYRSRHVSWCMSGSITRSGGENVPSIPSACTIRNFTYLARGPLTICFAVITVHNPLGPHNWNFNPTKYVNSSPWIALWIMAHYQIISAINIYDWIVHFLDSWRSVIRWECSNDHYWYTKIHNSIINMGLFDHLFIFAYTHHCYRSIRAVQCSARSRFGSQIGLTHQSIKLFRS